MLRNFYRNQKHHIRTRDFCIVLQGQNPHLKSFSNISESKNPSSITVDYLINSCGLPPETALTASKHIRLSSIKKADSVLTFFQNHGLNKTQITQLISKRPGILILDPNKILQPKIQFFHDFGFSGPNLVKLLAYDPSIITKSLHNQIIPTLNFLKSFIGTNDNILAILKRTAWGLQNIDKELRPNIAILLDQGVSECSISKLLLSHPRTLMHKTDRFKENIEVVKKLGLDSSNPMFVHAVQVLGLTSKSNWEGKLAVYRSFGFSEDEICSAIKRQPRCMFMSKEKIGRTIDFFMRKMKWRPLDISQHPDVVMRSLEKNIIPRCAVLEILNSKGVIRKKLKVTSVLVLAEKKFLDKFVMKYHETIPEVVEAYNGGIEFRGSDERRIAWGYGVLEG